MNWPKRTSAVASPYDAGGVPLLVQHQRARGEIDVVAKLRDGASVPERLYRSGCLHVRLPRAEQADWLQLVLMNMSGGIAAGDVLTTSIAVREGARLSVAAQAAERFYRAGPVRSPARLCNWLRVADGARLEWLPQESILFDDAAVDRTLRIDLDGDARFLGVEMLVFGRAASGESVGKVDLRDRIVLRHDGRRILHDAIRLDGDAETLLLRSALAGGARALATMILFGPESAGLVGPLRLALAACAVEAGVSCWNGFLLARILAPRSDVLRGAVTAGLAVLRSGRAMPRVWMC